MQEEDQGRATHSAPARRPTSLTLLRPTLYLPQDPALAQISSSPVSLPPPHNTMLLLLSLLSPSLGANAPPPFAVGSDFCLNPLALVRSLPSSVLSIRRLQFSQDASLLRLPSANAPHVPTGLQESVHLSKRTKPEKKRPPDASILADLQRRVQSPFRPT